MFFILFVVALTVRTGSRSTVLAENRGREGERLLTRCNALSHLNRLDSALYKAGGQQFRRVFFRDLYCVVHHTPTAVRPNACPPCPMFITHRTDRDSCTSPWQDARYYLSLIGVLLSILFNLLIALEIVLKHFSPSAIRRRRLWPLGEIGYDRADLRADLLMAAEVWGLGLMLLIQACFIFTTKTKKSSVEPDFLCACRGSPFFSLASQFQPDSIFFCDSIRSTSGSPRPALPRPANRRLLPNDLADDPCSRRSCLQAQIEHRRRGRSGEQPIGKGWG